MGGKNLYYSMLYKVTVLTFIGFSSNLQGPNPLSCKKKKNLGLPNSVSKSVSYSLYIVSTIQFTLPFSTIVVVVLNIDIW